MITEMKKKIVKTSISEIGKVQINQNEKGPTIIHR